MSGQANPPIGGGTNSRSLNDTVAETGPGVPTDAVGPGQLSVPEQLELSEGPEAEAMAAKLQREASRFQGEP
ncbi:hypothetical protein [Phenylobacterium deserti]|uniref:Uncharacterized protein n=1 Tax=Phenylobacterium deserti TaxID=1914756 RepID=A0A328A8T6_9CAUL|nr:hypothetical protein [Phenylobacterium deserti]RAK50980.1 hypothetical protein DJ018_17640 [Phenylobacterium deserti]